MTVPAILSPITGDSPRARRSDPLTSHAAADGVTAQAREASEIEVYAILAASSAPLSSEGVILRHAERVGAGLAERRWPDSRLRTALAQLVEKGLVVQSGEVRNRSGYKAYAWRVSGERGGR